MTTYPKKKRVGYDRVGEEYEEEEEEVPSNQIDFLKSGGIRVL